MLYQLFFEQGQDSMFIIRESDGRIIKVNDAAVKAYGYSRDEMLIMRIQDLFDPATVKAIESLQGGSLDECTIAAWHGHKDSSTFPVEVSLKTVATEGGKLLLGVIRKVAKRKLILDILKKAGGSVHADVTGRRETEEKINSYQKQLRSLAAQLSLVEEQERRRIAEGIHDHIGQSLAVSRLKMRALKRAASLVDVLAGLDEIIAIIEEVIMKTRSLTFELSPPVLYDLGFEAVVEWLGEQVLERNGVDVSINSELKSKPLDEDVRIFLFTAVRELFFNIIKHARAQKVFIDMQDLGEKIMVTVRDNGIGFDTGLCGPSPGKKAGFGLFSIRERLEHLGGRLEIVSRKGVGTSVSIEAPFENRP